MKGVPKVDLQNTCQAKGAQRTPPCPLLCAKRDTSCFLWGVSDHLSHFLRLAYFMLPYPSLLPPSPLIPHRSPPPPHLCIDPPFSSLPSPSPLPSPLLLSSPPSIHPFLTPSFTSSLHLPLSPPHPPSHPPRPPAVVLPATNEASKLWTAWVAIFRRTSSFVAP